MYSTGVKHFFRVGGRVVTMYEDVSPKEFIDTRWKASRAGQVGAEIMHLCHCMIYVQK